METRSVIRELKRHPDITSAATKCHRVWIQKWDGNLPFKPLSYFNFKGWHNYHLTDGETEAGNSVVDPKVILLSRENIKEQCLKALANPAWAE